MTTLGTADQHRLDGPSLSRRCVLLFAALVPAVCSAGCAAYQFGADAIFPSNIRTVYLPVVRNNTYRLDMGVRLTEALVREIERRTPYKVTGDPNADTTLTCTIIGESKVVLTEKDTDDPRALDANIAVKAKWTGRNGQLLMNNRLVPAEDPEIYFDQNARFVPEAGQSIATADQRVIENLAERIVSQMEMRW
jgi:hypothetical protein